MAINVLPIASSASKTMFRTTLTSGTSWTVPAGVTYVNVCLIGGGGSGGHTNNNMERDGYPGAVIFSTLATTPGASINYAIGAGGSGASVNNSGNPGGTTTFTGATSASGGNGGAVYNPTSATSASSANNGGVGGYFYPNLTNSGGAGRIDIEYWA